MGKTITGTDDKEYTIESNAHLREADLIGTKYNDKTVFLGGQPPASKIDDTADLGYTKCRESLEMSRPRTRSLHSVSPADQTVQLFRWHGYKHSL